MDALEAITRGAIFIPAGRYRITKAMNVRRGNIVFRGEGPEKTVLLFPVPLQTAVGEGAQNAPAGSWSWSGGFLNFHGSNEGAYLADVIQPAKRGTRVLRVSKPTAFFIGQRVRLIQKNRDGSLGRHIHNDQAPASPMLLEKRLVDFSCKVVGITYSNVTFDRPLRTDARLEWGPALYSDLPAVEEVGVESLSIVFPHKRYAGHHDEPGFNAIYFQDISNGWVKDVHIVNADSAVTLRNGVKFCTVQNVKFSAERGRSRGGWGAKRFEGHHGVQVADLSQDNLISDFDISAEFIHSISLTSLASGNVFMRGRGKDLSFDHHRKAPYENLFTDIDAGKGDALWDFGGDEEAGPPAGARETFWNVRTQRPVELPEWALQINLIGIKTDLPAGADAAGNWIEPLTADPLTPANLYESQKRKTPPAP